MPDWEQIVDGHAETVFRIAYRILGTTSDAEDVAQDVFTEAFEVRQKQPVENWTGLLRRLATVRSIDRLRRRRPVARLDEAQSASRDDPVNEASARELGEWLRTAIGKLPEQQAAVFSLTYFEQLSRSEIACSLNIAPEAVSTALYKARQTLQSRLPAITEESRNG